MTIGPDMPLRSLKDAIVGETGKGNRLPDRKAAKGKDDAVDFKSMLEAKPLRLPSEAGDGIAPDDVAAMDDEPEVEADDEPASTGPSVQAMFGQSILALEQLLDRQASAAGGQPGRENKPLRALDAHALTDGETALDTGENGQDEPPTPASLADRKSVADGADKPAVKTAANPDTKAQPDKADGPQPQPAEAAVADAPKARVSAKQAPEQVPPPAVNARALVAQPAPAADPRVTLATLAEAAPAAPQSRPAIADVQIISDHSTSAARTLVIQLQPVELGTVTARLRLTGEGMHIQLMAESRAAAEHLARDHEALGKALQRAGVADDASAVTISVIDRSGAVASTQPGQQAMTGQDQPAGGRGQANTGSQGTQGDRSSGQQHFGDSRPDESDDKTAKAMADRTVSRGLVV
ncbi:MAG: flagellar hook-length control protein FliK [Phyllobacterium sp.]|nr:flagellar hook-length control protein FliK [Phyllobacterium sp.]